MDDLNALERQIEGQLNGFVGPVLPVDDAAIFNDITAASKPTRWGFTMFSALKLVAAAAIVALFGGFLLAGILTTPDGEPMPPAAMTESPSPMTTEELLSSMVTEEVEPGVFRVVDDGERDLSPAAHEYVVVGQDGSIWLGSYAGDLSRLGAAETIGWARDVAISSLGPENERVAMSHFIDGDIALAADDHVAAAEHYTAAVEMMGRIEAPPPRLARAEGALASALVRDPAQRKRARELFRSAHARAKEAGPDGVPALTDIEKRAEDAGVIAGLPMVVP